MTTQCSKKNDCGLVQNLCSGSSTPGLVMVWGLKVTNK